MTKDIFDLRSNFHIKRISSLSLLRASDHVKNLRELVISEESMYPRIDRWFDRKVLSGLELAERVAYVGYLDNRPIVSAVVKSGRDAKFCHLKINEIARNNSIGDIFFALMTLDVRHRAERIHFTLPEGLWESKKEFFNSFGFGSAKKNPLQYRVGEDELSCSAPFSTVLHHTIDRLPKIASQFTIGDYSLDNKILLSVNPAHADKIVKGTKTVEVRRRFSSKWAGTRLNIYATRPVGAVIGEARIDKIVEGSPEEIWDVWGASIGSAKVEFDAYCNGAEKVSALLLTEVRPFHSAVPLEQIRRLLGKGLVPPQSFSNLARSEDWSRAVTVASILQGQVSRGIELVV